MREMKNSGIEWIGEIPSDWGIDRLQHHLVEIKVPNSPVQTEDILSLTIESGVIPYGEKGNQGNKAKENYEEYKLAYPNTLVVNSMNVIIGAVGISRFFGCVSPVYYVFKTSEETDLRYIYYLFTNVGFQKELRKFSKGILEIRLRISASDMLRRSIPLPTFAEQQRIADFLDCKCGEIDAVIAKTRATIEEYKKLKQSIITEAVTKGIRGERPMKDSCIEWIGLVPSKWDVIRIKWLLCERNERSVNGEEEPLSMSQKYGLIPTKDMDMVPNMASSFVGAKLAHIGDLVFNKLKAHLGVFAVSRYDGLVSPDYAVYYSAGKANLKYLEYLFKTPQYIAEFKKKSSGVGAGLTRLYTDDLYSISCGLPSLEEQVEIAEYIDHKCSEMDRLIAQKERVIAELEAYKKSLIYEYVTGKKSCDVAEQSVVTAVVYPYFPAVLSTNKPRFAQAVLMSRILDKCRKKMGRVKLEKMLYTIESSIGFDFDTEYAREAAGPLDGSIYECEGIVSRRNKWFTVHTSQYGVSYKPAKDSGKYKKYYDKYFADHDSEIERIIGVFSDYDADQAEIVATLFAAWNDFIIDRKPVTDEALADEVLNNWNDSKKRFSKDIWLRAIQQMRQNNIIPKGYGKHTVVKN